MTAQVAVVCIATALQNKSWVRSGKPKSFREHLRIQDGMSWSFKSQCSHCLWCSVFSVVVVVVVVVVVGLVGVVIVVVVVVLLVVAAAAATSSSIVV